MSHIRDMILAAREGNPAAFEKSFQSAIAERMEPALDAMRTSVWSQSLGLPTNNTAQEVDSE